MRNRKTLPLLDGKPSPAFKRILQCNDPKKLKSMMNKYYIERMCLIYKERKFYAEHKRYSDEKVKFEDDIKRLRRLETLCYQKKAAIEKDFAFETIKRAVS